MQTSVPDGTAVEAFASELVALARQVTKSRRDIFFATAGALALPSSIAFSSIVRIANACSPTLRASSFEWTDDDPNVNHEAVGRALLSRSKDKTKIGGTSIGAIALALAYSLLEWHSATALMQCACGLEHSDLDVDTYAKLFGSTVSTKDDFAEYLVAFVAGLGAFYPARIAKVVFAGTRKVALFRGASKVTLEERLDRWLSTNVPSSTPSVAARGVLTAIGMSSAEARALVALAPAMKASRRTALVAGKRIRPSAPALLESSPRRIRSPWLKRLAELSPAAAAKELSARFRDIPRWLAPISKVLLASRIDGVEPEGDFLRLKNDKAGSVYLLAPPITVKQARSSLAALGFRRDHLLVDLVTWFDALRNAPAHRAGGLVPVAKMATVANTRRRKDSSGAVLSSVDARELAYWHDAIVLYEATSADLLLVSPRGRIAWVRHGGDEGEQIEPHASLRKFVAEFESGWGS